MYGGVNVRRARAHGGVWELGKLELNRRERNPKEPRRRMDGWKGRNKHEAMGRENIGKCKETNIPRTK